MRGVPEALLTTAATTASLLVLAGVATLTGLPLFALPFAASAAIVALAPASPLAQPRNVVLGHVVGAAVALGAATILGPSVWTAAIAAGLSTAPMLLLKVPHPPATATVALVGLTAPDPLFLVSPVLVAAAVVVATGIVLGRLIPARRYPVSTR
ncbi:HPP family protein [Zhihengliuella sp. ISTPL4]|uniref:HPP family protein n=1 Tax=Zhihengliuella sp. ISTPL4 TaxID=2058657 RepID=UPI0013052D59|nr:HPP family protein [Zhihengliuella sp. ISTPL4]